MNTCHAFNAARSSFAIAIAALAASTAGAKDIRLDATCAPQMTRGETRLYQKASEGTDVLRAFIWIRRSIVQVDVFETAVWAEGVDAAREACVKALATSRAPRQSPTPQTQT